MAKKILIVDDEQPIVESIVNYLTAHEYETVTANNGLQAIEVYHATHPDLVLLDVMMPGMDGIEVCRELRKQGVKVPILIITALSDDEMHMKARDSDADDFIPKPFENNFLKTIIDANLRRFRPATEGEAGEDVIQIGPLTLDVVGHEVRRGNEKIQLTPLEFTLLQTLAMNPRQVFTREVLLEKVWGYQYKADTRLVNVHIQRLRSKIEVDPDDPKIVTTVRGIGYKAGTN